MLGGNDIAVYFVNDSKLKQPGVINKEKLYPACLPSKVHKNNRGILAGWKEPNNIGYWYPENGVQSENLKVEHYREQETILKHVRLDNTTCKDPDWMESNTFYPKGNDEFWKKT